MNEHRRKIGKKRTYNNIEDKIENALKSKTTKILIDFSIDESTSIKSFAILKKDQIKITTRFLSGKCLCLPSSP